VRESFSQIEKLPAGFTFHTGWKSPSNIALVKYWGKYGVQLPMNPSVSMTLSKAYSKTSISVKPAKERLIEFYFHKTRNDQFVPKIESFFDRIESLLPYLKTGHFIIESENSFPHSAGIASSASAMSSLALGMAELDEKLSGKEQTQEAFLKKSSWLARLASGSASRSIYPGYSLWGKTKDLNNSADEYATGIESVVHKNFKNVKDTVLIVSSRPKSVSSTAGHGLMAYHDFREARIEQAGNNITSILKILKEGDWESFIEIVEQEALTLHGLMMSSSSSFVLMKPNTLSIINKIREFRKQTSLPLCFTLDAGPNVHILYPQEYYGRIRKFINDELALYCENGYQLDDETGKGPEKLNLEAHE